MKRNHVILILLAVIGGIWVYFANRKKPAVTQPTANNGEMAQDKRSAEQSVMTPDRNVISMNGGNAPDNSLNAPVKRYAKGTVMTAEGDTVVKYFEVPQEVTSIEEYGNTLKIRNATWVTAEQWNAFVGGAKTSWDSIQKPTAGSLADPSQSVLSDMFSDVETIN